MALAEHDLTAPTTAAATEEAAATDAALAAAMDDYFFDLRGYLVLKNALSPELVARLNGSFDAFPPLEQFDWHGNMQRKDDNGTAGMEIQNIVEGGAAFEELIDHPSWIDRVRHYCGDEGSYTEGVFIDECFASVRRSGGFFPVHSGGFQGSSRGLYDYKDGQFRCAQVNILIALTDVGPGDGGTMIIPGSHKSNFKHPQTTDYGTPMDKMEGVMEVHLKAGDALLFTDGIAHGASARTNPGERRVVIYRYGVRWGCTRYGYAYSDALLSRLSPERRAVLQPVAPRRPPAGV